MTKIYFNSLIKTFFLFTYPLCLAIAIPKHTLAQHIEGKVIAVKDGDTIELLINNQPTKVRLYGIDCPELHQDFGREATKYTASQCFNQKVKLNSYGKDKYKRVLGEIILPNGKILNQLIVEHGFAWRYKHSKDAELLRLEQKARAKKLGLWIMLKPCPPWEFRKSVAQKNPQPKQ
ncbi:MAG: hypothetical protein EAZ07_09185 [Cytophagales bacterium]|nr:MAG: hypothetical protein EAZ07_09185 [Cytophagales bacterium]